MEPVLTNPDVYLITGLGNPGREYKETRHNVGFMVVERLASQFKWTAVLLLGKSLRYRAGAATRPLRLAPAN